MNDAALDHAAELIAQADALIVAADAGTSVPSVRHFSQLMVAAHCGRIVRINVREPDVAAAFGVGLANSALPALQALDARLG